MNRLSAVIITHNEERNIARCIESLQGIADEIVVVDSGSTDQTEAICQHYGVRFAYHAWEDYSAQKNYAETLVSFPWILSIDADEALDDSLRHSINSFFGSNPSTNTVCRVRRLNNFGGRWIKHGGWYPDEKIRLWHHGICRWDGLVHEELSFAQPVVVKQLDGYLLHYTYNDITELAQRNLKYAFLAAEKAFQLGKHAGTGNLWFRPKWTFFRNYILKGGFLDGRPGYEICRVSALYTFLKYARLKELQAGKLPKGTRV
ncbi:MAG: glycosyltransferase family 2 protein [Bacteroidales bacterium]|nr:glycosyltransferase family 2 protein [Candidatus Colimorpha merdihippi]